MQQIIFSLVFVAFCHAVPIPEPVPEPQDLQTGLLLLAGQMKDILDNGAAARDETKFEFMGMKVSNNMGMGFGDAIRIPGGRYRREIDAFGVGNSNSFEWDYSSSSSSEYYSSESEELGPSKVVGKEEKRDKRAVANSSSVESDSSSSSSSFSSSSSSSSSSSGESEER